MHSVILREELSYTDTIPFLEEQIEASIVKQSLESLIFKVHTVFLVTSQSICSGGVFVKIQPARSEMMSRVLFSCVYHFLCFALNPSSKTPLAFCGALLSLLSAGGTRRLVLQRDLSDRVLSLN